MSDKWQGVVEGLLTKANDPGCTDAERELLLEKASYLIAKYGIEEAKARETQAGEPVIYLDIPSAEPYRLRKMDLIITITRNLGCRSIRISPRMLRVFGYKGDIDRAKLLYASLLTQMLFGVMAAEADKPPMEHGKAFKNSWLYGFIHKVDERMAEANRKLQAEPSNLPAIRHRYQEVDMAVSEMFPKLGKTRPGRLSSNSGYNAGQSAGSRADLGGAKLSGGRKAIGA